MSKLSQHKSNLRSSNLEVCLKYPALLLEMTNYCPCLLPEPKQTDVNRTSFSNENRRKLSCDEEGTFSPLADTFVFLCDAVRFCA